MNALLSRARDWAVTDPNPTDREELEALIASAESGDADAAGELGDRFQGELEFGTAGLRGLMGAGESRMNEAVVLRATRGLCMTLLARVANASSRGVVLGYDARLRSEALAKAAAEVIAGAGLRVILLPRQAPTPVVAFAVRHLGAAAGVVVTASHNPPQYNGYKVYWENGAQIIPPIDASIAEEIRRAPPPNEIPRAPAFAMADREADRLESAYLEAIRGLLRPRESRAPIRIAYTPLHGVGGRLATRALQQAGFEPPIVVPEQAEPDGRFPTVSFPNPEEPGALDLLRECARGAAVDVAFANDPDADRLAICAPDGSGRYVPLTGNEVGVLLAYHLLTRDRSFDPSRLVVTTVVSTRQLRRLAQNLQVRYAETLTGFKWITNRAVALEETEGARFLFGFEEALGYTVGTVTRDKDGIGALLVAAEMVAAAKARGESLLELLRRIQEEHGVYVGRQKSLTLPGREGGERIAEMMERLRASPPTDLGGTPIAELRDLDKPEAPELPRSNVLLFDLEDGGRVAVRPSGTEPKIKLYMEVVEEAKGSVEEAKLRGQSRLDRIEADLLDRAGGLGPPGHSVA